VECQISASHMSLDVRPLKACWYVGGCNTISVSLEYVVSADNFAESGLSSTLRSLHISIMDFHYLVTLRTESHA
jgi:hypothetical protein